MKGSDSNAETLHSITFNLTISSDDYLKYYRGEVRWVIVMSLCGKKVRFPANLLANHVTHNGVQGRFVLQYLANGKAVKLTKTA